MKTKHILAVLSTCLVAVSFSPINFFSQAAPPPGFTMFDGKEFQFDCTSLDANMWHLAFTCPPAGTMKITNARSIFLNTAGPSYETGEQIVIRVTRSSSSQVIYTKYLGLYQNSAAPPASIMLSNGDTVEYFLPGGSTSSSESASIIGVIS